MRPPSMFPISSLLSGTLITHFEGAASFVGHALSPVNFNDSNLSWPEVTTLQLGTRLHEFCGSLLRRIVMVGTLEVNPSIKFSLKLIKVDKEVCFMVIDGPTSML